MTTTTKQRTVEFYPISEPNDPDPDYRFQVRINLCWLKDGDSMVRQENVGGRTATIAMFRARQVAAQFMAAHDIGPDDWPEARMTSVAVITYENAIRYAGDLASEHGENPEYDRALVELLADLFGIPMDLKDKIDDDIRNYKPVIPAN